MKRWGFCGGAYQDTSKNVNAEVCENWVPEFTAPGNAKSPIVLKARPGLVLFGTAGSGPHRARYEQNGRAFVLSGTTLYEASSDGTMTSRGTVAYGSDPGSIHGNGTQLYIVSGGLGYIFTLATNVLAQITDPQYPADVAMGFYINGHFGAITRDSREFSISDEFDGTAWAAADIANKSKSTDNLVGAVVDQDSHQLWLIGSQFTEVWWYSGAAGFPLEPIPNTLVQTGAAAPWSWIPVGGSVYGLGQSVDGGRVVVRFQSGYTPERISHHGLEAAIQRYSPGDIASARAFSVEFEGHRCYALSFTDRTTWVFDEATSLWHEWTYWNSDTASKEAFLGVTHMFAFGKHLVGSRKDGQVYELSPTYLDDAGDAIRCVRRAPYISDGPRQFVHTRLWFDFQVGVGLVSGQGSAPVGMVRYSDDSCATWSQEMTVSLGALGVSDTMAELWALGLAGPAGRVYELVVTDPVVRALVDCDVDVERERAA